MIQDWREAFNVADAPFGFVQLSTQLYNNTGLTYPQVRWHQTADLGSVPNKLMERVYMAVAVDTYDEESGIHPRYKRIVADRLAVAGLRTAYGLAAYPNHGPVVMITGASVDALHLAYDQAVVLNTEELSGFYYCCDEAAACFEAGGLAAWPAVAADMVALSFDNRTVDIRWEALLVCPDERLPSLGYLWRQTPIAAPTWGAPIYAADEFRLPAAPWIWHDLPQPTSRNRVVYF
jgi:sialate O-acetylesterase